MRASELGEKGDEKVMVKVGSSDGFIHEVGSRDGLAGVLEVVAEQQGR